LRAGERVVLLDFEREEAERDFAAARVVGLRPDFDLAAEDRPAVVRLAVRLFVRLAALALPPAAERLVDVLDFARVADLRPAAVRLEAVLRRVELAFRVPVERDEDAREEEERDFDFEPTRSGFPLRLVDAISSSCFSDMDSSMPREAPLSLDFGVLPRFAESAAPAAFCWAPDLAGIFMASPEVQLHSEGNTPRE
jgi:hypothetical protein